MSKEKDKELVEHHTGSVAAEDDAFTEWLNRLWARGEPPERMELWQSHGKNMVRGNLIFHQDFTPTDKKMNPEQINKMANEILAAAQDDCNAVMKKCSYELSIVDRNRKIAPLTRRIGPRFPNKPDGRPVDLDNIEEDDQENMNTKALMFRYSKELIDQVNRDKNRNDQVVSGMFLMQHRIIENQQVTIDRLLDKTFTQHQTLQDSLDRSLDRELVRAKEKFKQNLWEEGFRSFRNILPGLFAGAQPQQQLPAGPVTAQLVYGPSPEKTLIGNLLSDISTNEELDKILFGDFAEVEGKIVQSREGIFGVKQMGILRGVHEGKFPVEALDDLMPDSGTPLAVTQEQMEKAMNANIPQSMLIALGELFALRNRAREARLANQTAQTPTNNEVRK